MSERFVIHNAKVVLEKEILENGCVAVENGKIVYVGAGQVPEVYAPFEKIDAAGDILTPGFIDIHVHGGGDYDFMDDTAEDIVRACRSHMRHGTTTIVPTSVSSTDAELFAFFDNFKAAKQVREDMPHVPGVHLEGPFLSPEQSGAMVPELIVPPKPEHVAEILRRGGDDIIRWTVAPETEGAMRLGDELKERGIVASIGHSNAEYEVVKEAIKHGYSMVTHLYSACSTITRRLGFRVLGVIECAYLFDELKVEIIADGKHLPPELLRMILKCKDHNSITLITDSMRGAGMPDGDTTLGNRRAAHRAIIKDGVAYMPDFSCFAGSVATTDRLVRTMTTQAGLDLREAVNMASLHPAEILKLDNVCGSIAVGKNADLVLLGRDIYTKRVWVSGKECTAK